MALFRIWTVSCRARSAFSAAENDLMDRCGFSGQKAKTCCLGLSLAGPDRLQRLVEQRSKFAAIRCRCAGS
jgi:hypothetical protein